MVKPINNPASERAVLSGIFQHGADAFIDVDDIIDTDTFTLEENQIVYACLKRVLNKSSSIDLPSVLSAAEDLGLQDFFNEKISSDHIKAIASFEVELENVRQHAIKLKKLDVARDIRTKIRKINSDIGDVTGEESIDEILNIAEGPIFDLSTALNHSVEDKPSVLGEEVEDYVTYLEENPANMLGLSSGFLRYDTAIGGGFRRKCVDLIAARPKVGKSMMADNVAINIAANLDVPVLLLDTEMSKEDHLNRIVSNISKVPINTISTGRFSKSAIEKEKVRAAAAKLKDIPYSYISIAGKPFEETLSIMRRWIVQNVGFDENGRTNECLIVYDYLKLMTSDSIGSSLQEFQVLGFQITSLHNFCVQYDCPCLSFVQLNRDGITKESTDVVSGSDRLIWLCTSFSIFKNKSDEEIAEDGVENGNRKLVPLVSRHGPGLNDGDYINMSMKGDVSKIDEGITRNELKKNGKQDNQGFVVDEDKSEPVPFSEE